MIYRTKMLNQSSDNWIIHPIQIVGLKMNLKIISVIAAIIIVAAGGSALLLINNDNNNEYKSTDNSGRLAILGNANNDDYIDDDDLATIDAIIDGTTSKEDHPLADADNNGTVDSEDRKIVERMIKREKMDIWYINGNDEIKKVGYPLNRVVVVGTNAALTLQALGAVTNGKVVGTTGEATKDYFLFSDFKDLPKVSTSVLVADYDAVTNIGGVDAIITMSSKAYLKNESTFTDAGIDVVRISSSNGLKAISVALTMGYLLNLEERANEYAKFCDKVISHISEKKETIKNEDVRSCLCATMANYVSGTTSDYYTLTIMCGGDNRADWSTVTKQFNAGDEWLLNDKYNVDAFIHYHNYTYDPSEDLHTMYKSYRENFEALQTVKDGNYCMVNGNMPAVVRLAYTASILYPEIFGSDFGDKVHQEYVDNFLDNLSFQHYKVTDMKFVLKDSDFGISP